MGRDWDSQPGYNPILMTDSYKLTHYKMYPPGTEHVGSYFENRAGGEYPYTVFFGLQYLLMRYLEDVVVTQSDLDDAIEVSNQHFGQELLNVEGWKHIINEHGGRLPVSIRAVPEGTVVDESNVLMTIENTDPKCYWLTNHLETLLVQLWYPCTVATISREQKRVLRAGLEATAENADGLPFMLHDFGYRGSSSIESAAIGDAAHLINFMGTDTIAGIELLRKYYDADMPAFSVPAAEHSTITSWESSDGEIGAFRNILKQYPQGIVSVVSDSYDIYQACRNFWGEELYEDVVNGFNENGRRIVVRPDSGDPATVLVDCLKILEDKFGSDQNAKGYKVLPPCIRVIYGDGIDRRSLPDIVAAIADADFSLENVVFGSGGGLLQDCNRDTQRMAMKCSWIQRDGKVEDVSKRPVSDLGKYSKSGKLKLVLGEDKRYSTVGIGEFGKNRLVEVFRDGQILKRTTLEEIRKRAA